MRGCENQQQIFFLTQFSEQGQQQHYLKGRMAYEQRMKRWDFPAHGSKLLPAAEFLQTPMKKKSGWKEKAEPGPGLLEDGVFWMKSLKTVAMECEQLH